LVVENIFSDEDLQLELGSPPVTTLGVVSVKKVFFRYNFFLVEGI